MSLRLWQNKQDRSEGNMGYTHYWYRPTTISEEEYGTIIRDVQKMMSVFRRKNIRVQLEESLYKAENKGIVIEGTCETFIFPIQIHEEFKKYYPMTKDGKIFQFVKTNRGTYDIGVQIVLIIAKQYLTDRIIVTSDGEEWHWQNAKELVQEHLGYGHDFSLDESPSFEEMGMKVTWTTIDGEEIN